MSVISSEIENLFIHNSRNGMMTILKSKDTFTTCKNGSQQISLLSLC